MKLVYCINAYPRPQSRTQTILQWLNQNNIKYVYVTPGFKPSLNIVFRKIFSSICSNYYHSRLIDGLFLALSIYPSLIWQSFFRRKECTVLVCFESWEIYPFLIIYRLFRIARVVVDLGYPAADISAASLPKNYIQRVTILEQNLNQSGVNLLVESEQQCERVKASLSKPIIYAHFVLESTGLIDPASKPRVGLPSFLGPCSNYILFRGTLNQESGILESARSFGTYLKRNPGFPLDLVIHGSGELKLELQKLIASLERVYYFPDYLEAAELCQLMRGASATIGQFNVYSPRLLLTIPHKFVESLKLYKLYMTPLFPPTEFYLKSLLKVDSFNRIMNSRDPFSEWLSMIHDDKSICQSPSIQRASLETLEHMKHINQKSMMSAIFP